MSHFKIILILIAIAGLLYLPVHFFVLSSGGPVSVPTVENKNVGVSPADESGGSVVVADKLDTDGDAVGDMEDAADDVSGYTQLNDGSNLAPTKFTPDTYRPITYDPFKNTPDEFNEEIVVDDSVNSPPSASINITTDMKGFADKNSGLTGTEFYFSASGSDKETSSSRLQYRWDFESDGVSDTYFSRTRSARHVYDSSGVYTVTVEVLDEGGAVGASREQVKVVNNTPPVARFVVEPKLGTTNSIFIFKTGDSDDSQFVKNVLEYRFDWDGDGVWDTPYSGKDTWRHIFGSFESAGAGDVTVSRGGAGNYKVIMEVKDPAGAVATVSDSVTVIDNTPPNAEFTYEAKDTTTYMYYFDASRSWDAEEFQRLQYRWDFDYTGPDDINYDTGWSISAKYSGTFKFAGDRIVRLQVKDDDGATDEALLEVVAY